MNSILVQDNGGVRTLTINRVNKKNCLTSAIFLELCQHLDTSREDSNVRVLCLQGHESVFSAGYDITDFLSAPPQNENTPVIDFLKKLVTFPKPILAGVCGPAVGIGLTMLLHCDLVYCGDNAAFSAPFVNLGLCAEGGSSLLLPQLIGHARAAEILMLGEPFSPETALELGLVNRVLPPSEVNAFLATQAKKLASKPLSSIMETKRLMKQNVTNQVIDQIRAEIEVFGKMLTGPAAQEAFNAFMEKRHPDFSHL